MAVYGQFRVRMGNECILLNRLVFFANPLAEYDKPSQQLGILNGGISTLKNHASKLQFVNERQDFFGHITEKWHSTILFFVAPHRSVI